MHPHKPFPRFIPVIDIMGGRGARSGGNAASVRADHLSPHREPQGVRHCHALLEMTGAKELYIADLDAIMGRPRVDPAVTGILNLWPVLTWLDAGIGRRLTVADLPALPQARPVVGFETCFRPDKLALALEQAGSGRSPSRSTSSAATCRQLAELATRWRSRRPHTGPARGGNGRPLASRPRPCPRRHRHRCGHGTAPPGDP